jgi:hypothetical protein
MVSVSTLPYNMAPNRPLPIGNAFSQVAPAGVLYQSFSACFVWAWQISAGKSSKASIPFFIVKNYDAKNKCFIYNYFMRHLFFTGKGQVDVWVQG